MQNQFDLSPQYIIANSENDNVILSYSHPKLCSLLTKTKMIASNAFANFYHDVIMLIKVIKNMKSYHKL